MHLHSRTIFIGLIVVLTPVPVRAGSPRQISWRELSVATGKNVSVVMLGGAVISGKAVAVDADAMTVKVARTTDPRAYPKGEMRVPRASLRTLQVQTKGRKFRLIGTFFGANAGVARSFQAAIRIQSGVLSTKHPAAAVAAFIAMAAGGTRLPAILSAIGQTGALRPMSFWHAHAGARMPVGFGGVV